MGWESFGVVRFNLRPLLQGQTRIAKVFITCLLLVLEVWDGKINLYEIMGRKSFGVVGFDLGPLLQGQTRIANLKVLITHLLLILEVYSAKPTHTKSWARNLLMSDLTFGPSFKVKRWFTGFGELSFRWIQICIGPNLKKYYWDNIVFYLEDKLQDCNLYLP